MEHFDCVVVGAGWYGLAAAKQYRCTKPESSLAIFDSQATLGGTWAEERLYPGLKSNNLLGSYEFPDFPMDSETFQVQPGQHIPGEAINAYLKAYATTFGIASKIRSSQKVLTAEHLETPEGGWFLTVSGVDEKEMKVFTRRLIVATGLTSKSWLPRFAGQESFGCRIFHGKDFQQNSDTLKTAKSVTILGGSKLAWDAVYAYAVAGVKPSDTRIVTWFSPCVWGNADGFTCTRNFLHRTATGRAIVNTFWKVLGANIMSRSPYRSHHDIAKLRPWTEPIFTGASFSILNYETDFFGLVKSGAVKVHLGEIDHLSPGNVHLSDGTQFPADILLAYTGWEQVPPIRFLPEGIENELGIPHERANAGVFEDLAGRSDLVDLADKEILDRFPRLKRQSVWKKHRVPLTEPKDIETNDTVTPHKSLTPYMLHRFIVPPANRFLRTRDTVFVGIVSNFSTAITAHLQGLWVTAYFSGLLAKDPAAAVGDKPALEKLQYDTVLLNRFGRWRCPTDWGAVGSPSFVLDAVPYLDLLQRDLGLDPYRKHCFIAEIYSPYGPEDYREVNEEWLTIFGGTKALPVP
ncbi:FAD-containing monooxygenase EthA 1 [Colletotrichum chlorophyti]|uniref:FAD-containing monooxygenase EthA 1 n=1 Tax=Colletotrichum chlorophyti TaxID=708187 RepID=A0A1Q8RRC8_9PEZI|nr:FAD-containing monooxygenase EthA 1 [Colletotrichum chlorophyti]